MALLSLLDVLAQRALVADGAMGAILQSVELLSLDELHRRLRTTRIGSVLTSV